MTLTPINYVVDDLQDESIAETLSQTEPSKTWKLDLENGRIEKQIDGAEAVRQYIRKALLTARNRYLIYDDAYGEEIRDLIGYNLTPALMDVEIPRLVREAIEYDDRISSVPSVEVSRYNADSILITVTVETIEGLFITEEVAI